MFRRIVLPAAVCLALVTGLIGVTGGEGFQAVGAKPEKTPRKTVTPLPSLSPTLAPTPEPDEPLTPPPPPSPSPSPTITL